MNQVSNVPSAFASKTNDNRNSFCTTTMYDMLPITLEPEVEPVLEFQPPAKESVSDYEILNKVIQLVHLCHLQRNLVSDFLAKEANLLSTFDFARLMLAAEQYTRASFENERFYVFLYPNGVVGSVWIYGQEAYTSPRSRLQ